MLPLSLVLQKNALAKMCGSFCAITSRRVIGVGCWTWKTKILEGLTSQQRKAVVASATEPLLINAAAGTGKTHVLARRILYLQAIDGIEPERILCLSFSRAGARAIGSRVQKLAEDFGLVGLECRHSIPSAAAC